MSEYVVGLDVGSSKVYGAVGRIDKNGKLSIIGVSSVICDGIKKSVVVDIDSTTQAIKECVLQLKNMVDIKINNAYISLSGSMCRLVDNKSMIAISSENREISELDVKRVLDAASSIGVNSDEEVIGTVPMQYMVDGYDNVKYPVGMSGNRLEVEAKIIISKSAVVTNLFKSFNKAGINIKGIILQPIAASLAVLRDDETNLGIAIVDVGAETSDISIFKGNNLCYTSFLNLGGDNVTNDLSICLNIPLIEAERIKIRYGSLNLSVPEDVNVSIKSAFNKESEVQLKMVNEIIEARVGEILKFIKKRFENSGYYDEISGIIIVGGGLSLIDGICDLGSKIIGKNVRIGSPDYISASNPVYANCIGILKDAVKSQKYSEISMDFDEFSQEENHKKEVTENESLVSKIKNFLGDFF